MEHPPLTLQRRLHILMQAAFGKTFWVFAIFALVMGILTYNILGPEKFNEALSNDIKHLLSIMPRVVAALTLAGFIWILMPRDKFSNLVGRYRGIKGIMLASFAGFITPGGPSAAFPFLAIIARAGADRGVMVAYITSWAILGIQRILVWDLPFMGAEITITRFLVSIPLPIIAGLIAQQIPIPLVIGDEQEHKTSS